jgi:hypothetical protein
MKKDPRRIAARVATVALAALPALALAESSTDTTPHDGTRTLATSASLDFRINIPRFLFLQVGTGNRAGSTTVNTVDFLVDATNVGTGQSVSGGSVTASVIGNIGNVRLKSTTTGALKNADGDADTISFGQIAVQANALNTASVLPHPTLVDQGETEVTLTAVNKIVRQDAEWTFSYSNSNVVAPGLYGGSTARNGRVTYTATAP